MQNIALLVEGDGDKVAVPVLLRKVCNDLNISNLNFLNNPMKAGEAKKLLSAGRLEKFLHHAANRDPQGILIVVDVDEVCPVEVVQGLLTRTQKISHDHFSRVAFAFMNPEFEVLALHSIDQLGGLFGKEFKPPDVLDMKRFENEKRDAKGEISKCLPKNRCYKPSTHQVKLVHYLKLKDLRANSRCYRHLEAALQWLADEESNEKLFPSITRVQEALQ